MDPLVITHVHKTYRLDKVLVKALSDITLRVQPDRFTVLSGASGSGKTTLLNLIGCIDQPDQGEIVVAGQSMAKLSDNALSDFRLRHIGFVFQNFNLLPVLSAYENVEYPLILTRMRAPQRRRRVQELLEAVGLTPCALHWPGQLSGGQRQRVAIARALATSPELVLADEPTANLDSQTGSAIIQLMRSMQREYHATFVFSSHDPKVLAAADEAVFLQDGCVTGVEHRTASEGPVMNTLALALRNLARNRRRSLATLLSMMIGAISILLFGGYVRNIVYGLQTDYVRDGGHLQLQHRDYFLYGSGDPTAYGIADYQHVINVVRTDPVLAPMLTVVTPTIEFGGIAGNFDAGVSRTILASGALVDEQNAMRLWNDYGFPGVADVSPLTGTPDDAVVIGTGVARVLRLCAALHVSDCPQPQAAPVSGAPLPSDVALLSSSDTSSAGPPPSAEVARIELLAATAAGAPNVARLSVVKAEEQGVKQLDDIYVAMHLHQAQRLLYGKSQPQVTAIELQLRHTAQIPAARERLQQLLSTSLSDAPLAVYDFRTLNPYYGQAIALFDAIFFFMAILIGAIVLFTVGNTMNAAVVERTVEIGTLRAIGLRRAGIRALFVCEGLLLGAIGAALGLLAALGLAYLINHGGLTWTPPGRVDAIPLHVRVWGESPMLLGTALGLMVVAVLSAWWPARRAARLQVVEALRHV